MFWGVYWGILGGCVGVFWMYLCSFGGFVFVGNNKGAIKEKHIKKLCLFFSYVNRSSGLHSFIGLSVFP